MMFKFSEDDVGWPNFQIPRKPMECKLTSSSIEGTELLPQTKIFELLYLCNRKHTFMQQATYIYATGNIHLCNRKKHVNYQIWDRKKLKKLFLFWIRHAALLMEGYFKLLIFVCTGMRLKETERKPGIILYCTVLYCTVLSCTVLYCTVLYCTVLYCTVL